MGRRGGAGWVRQAAGLGLGAVVIGARCPPSEEILNYVLVRVQPPLPGLPRPRFSLYLSAQLQIGVIRVYSQQCQYLVGKGGKAQIRGRVAWPCGSEARRALHLALPACRGHPAHPGAPTPCTAADSHGYGGD